MRRSGPRPPRPPLDEARLAELSVAYVARFATTRAKLAGYLRRKLGERGWAGPGEPPVDELVERAARSGYVDDAAFALSRSRALTARGYGPRRVAQALHAAGVDAAAGEGARAAAAESAIEAAIAFARRRRLGPFGIVPPSGPLFEKQLAAMIRAGHALPLAKAVLRLPQGSEGDRDALAEVGFDVERNIV